MTIEGHEDQLKSYITSYYKNLFGAPEECTFSLDESRTNDIAQVSNEENSLLTAPYNEDEVRKAVFQMEHNKAPGQMVSLLSFIKIFGTLSSQIFYSCSVVFIAVNWSYSG